MNLSAGKKGAASLVLDPRELTPPQQKWAAADAEGFNAALAAAAAAAAAAVASNNGAAHAAAATADTPSLPLLALQRRPNAEGAFDPVSQTPDATTAAAAAATSGAAESSVTSASAAAALSPCSVLATTTLARNNGIHSLKWPRKFAKLHTKR